MKIESLELTNVRTVKTAKFHFHPTTNLIVGVNGIGKTTVLDVLAYCLSAKTAFCNSSTDHPVMFDCKDIRKDESATFLLAKCEVNFSGQIRTISLQVQFSTETSLVSPGMQVRLDDNVGQRELFEDYNLAVLFSINRSLANERQPRERAAAAGIAAGFAGAHSKNPPDLRESADWLLGLHAPSKTPPSSAKTLNSLNMAISRFLPNYAHIEAVANHAAPYLGIKRHGKLLPVTSLSGGEQSILAIVLDLIRRLERTNPDLDDPAAEAEAVVLIDEVELHLHPAWQRQIVRKLTDTFPRCQFIATTHSPQVIGEVEHECLHVMDEDGVHSPTCSYGVDSNRVLEEIMNTNPRTEAVEELLKKISDAIVRNQYEDARSMLAKLSGYLGENDPEIARAETLMRFMTEDS